MRALAAVLIVAMILIAPAAASAQGRLLVQPTHVVPPAPAAPAGPVVSVAPVTIDDEESLEAIQRLSERLADRLRPLEQRLREDDRLRRAKTVVGLSAVALGALRGTRPLTFAGTQALRFGLHKQLTTIRQRSGFVVEPSIGHRSISVTVNKVF
jgi:hypothetical protein